MGGGGPSSLKFLPGVGWGRCKFIYILFGGGGVLGNLETPLATPLIPRVTRDKYNYAMPVL